MIPPYCCEDYDQSTKKFSTQEDVFESSQTETIKHIFPDAVRIRVFH